MSIELPHARNLGFVNTQNLPLISVYVETARQVPGATIQIQTSAVQTINRTWKIKTISLECETAFKYELETSTLFFKLINQIGFLPLNNTYQDLFNRFRDTCFKSRACDRVSSGLAW